jgi:4-hydroxy-tetrahydrodipicolinate reductase
MRTDQQPIRLTLVAPNGRMGKAIAAAAEEKGDFVIDPDHGDVIVDFSSPEALAASLDRAVRSATPILIGTTGLDDLAGRRIKEASRSVAVLQAANTSLGVALLAELVGQAARALGPKWDVEILEMHHRHKRDAPSGTALMLGAAASAPSGEFKREESRSGRQLARQGGAIGFASLRGGSVVGDHDVIFATEGERLILSHRADDRKIFAHGALAAARFLHHQREPGLYTMRDVVGAS